MTVAALTYARHAATGRVSFTRISDDIYYDLGFPQPADILAKLSATTDTKDLLASYLPQHHLCKALKAKYAEARAKSGDTGPARIPSGPTLKLGKQLMSASRAGAHFAQRIGIQSARRAVVLVGFASSIATFYKAFA